MHGWRCRGCPNDGSEWCGAGLPRGVDAWRSWTRAIERMQGGVGRRGSAASTVQGRAAAGRGWSVTGMMDGHDQVTEALTALIEGRGAERAACAR